MNRKHTGRIIRFESDDPFLNLAVDHALVQALPNSTDRLIVRLWHNPPAVVLGRGQDLIAEINTDYCERNGIVVSRRISGGGAVFHDYGNLNISYVAERSVCGPHTGIHDIASQFTEHLIRSLASCGIPDLEIKDRSSILTAGTKVSGAASYMQRKAILHHCTLLLSSDLDALENALNAKETSPSDPRASRYSPTRNLTELTEDEIVTQHLKTIQDAFQVQLREGELIDHELAVARQLADNLYSSQFWIKHGKRGGIA